MNKYHKLNFVSFSTPDVLLWNVGCRMSFELPAETHRLCSPSASGMLSPTVLSSRDYPEQQQHFLAAAVGACVPARTAA
jgi:hypothetical protein